MVILYEKNINVRYSEMAQDMELKPSSLLHFLEDLASESAENLGFGYTFVRENNVAWVLLKYHMEFETYPKNIYDLKIVTEPRGYNRLFAFRDFELYEGDTLLGRVASTWSLIDMETRNIVPVPQLLTDNPNMNPFEKRDSDISYEKIKPLQKVDSECVYTVRYEDIDVNRHANNSNYIVWAFETLPFEFREKNTLKSLDMVFKKEIKYGEEVLSQVEIDGNRTNHVVKSLETGEDLCLISANWIEK